MEKKAGEQVFAGMVDEVLAARIVNRAENNASKAAEKKPAGAAVNGEEKGGDANRFARCRGSRGMIAAAIAAVIGILGLIALAGFLRRLIGRR